MVIRPMTRAKIGESWGIILKKDIRCIYTKGLGWGDGWTGKWKVQIDGEQESRFVEPENIHIQEPTEADLPSGEKGKLWDQSQGQGGENRGHNTEHFGHVPHYSGTGIAYDSRGRAWEWRGFASAGGADWVGLRGCLQFTLQEENNWLVWRW